MKLVVRVAVGAVLPAVLVAGYAVKTSASSNPYYPPLSVITRRFADTWLFADVPTQVVPSLRNLLLGFVIAILVGVPLGIALGRVRWLTDMTLPLVHFFRSIPPIMFIPPFVLIFGIGDLSKISIIVIGAVFPVVIASMDGVREIDPALLDVARAMRLSRGATITRIYLPSAAPAISGGVETGLQFALVLMVSSEMLAATRGIGYITMQAQATFDAAGVWAGIILLSLIGLLLNLLFKLCRNKLLAWHVGMHRALKLQ